LVSGNFDVLNPNIKSFLLWVEGKFIKINFTVFSIMEPWFSATIKLLFSYFQMDAFNVTVGFPTLYVITPNMRSFWLLVE